MRPIKEALELIDPEAILEEVAVRRSLIRDMVGWLYPSILRGEIEKLLTRYYELPKTS